MIYSKTQKRAFFSDKVGIRDSQLLDLAQEIACEKVFKKNDDIAKIGDLQKNLYFLVEGVVFGTMECDGETVITNLEHLPGTPLCGTRGIDLNTPISSGLVAATKCILLEVPMQAVVDYRSQFPEINELAMYYLSRNMVQQQKVRRMYSMNAEEKTSWFQKTYPMVKNILQKKYVAMFLALDPCVYRRTVRDMEKRLIGQLQFSPVI